MKKLLFFASAIALLASCSKNLTEDVAAPEVKGTNKIVASYEMNAETRAHFNGIKLAWDRGDALGVFANTAVEAEEDDAKTTDKTNAYFGYDGTVFYGDLMSVSGSNFYIYYPWNEGKKIEDNVITFTIPATQNFNHKNNGMAANGVAYGSFASGTVPAIGEASLEGEKTEDSELATEMKPLASFISLPIHGSGLIKKIKLEIKNSEGEALALAGNVTVTLEEDEETEEFFTAEFDEQSSDKAIVLNCGEGVTITETNKFFMFVVRPELTLNSEEEFCITINDETEALSYKLSKLEKPHVVGRNKIQPINDKAGYLWVEGATGSYLIDDAYDFLQYAYAATYGVDKDTTPKELLVVEDGEVKEPAALRPATIIKPITFEGLQPADVKWGDAMKYSEYLQTVLKSYIEKGGIETIGGGDNSVAYSITGKVAGTNPAATITKLPVVGNGIFGHKEQSTVKDIILDGATVNAGNAVNAYFLTDVIATNYTAFTGITVNGGTLTTTAENAAKSLFKQVYTVWLGAAQKNVTVNAYPADTKFANTLYVNGMATLDSQYANAEGVAFNHISGHQSGIGAIVTVVNAAAAEKFVKAIDLSGTGTKWFSVVTRVAAAETPAPAADAAEPAVATSFWTGLKATAVNDDGVFTAEELAYNVSTNAALSILTNDIDLLNGKWENVVNEATTYNFTVVDGKKSMTENYTISNVNLVVDENSKFNPGKTDAYLSLFGYRANVKNLNVKGIAIDEAKLPEAIKNCYAAGLASVGSANNVKVENATIATETFTKTTDDYHQGETGAMFAYATDLQNVFVTNSTITSKAKKFGYIAGKLHFDNSKNEYTFANIWAYTTPEGVGYKAFGEIEVELKGDTQNYLTVNFTDMQASIPSSDFKFVGVPDASIVVFLHQNDAPVEVITGNVPAAKQ